MRGKLEVWMVKSKCSKTRKINSPALTIPFLPESSIIRKQIRRIKHKTIIDTTNKYTPLRQRHLVVLQVDRILVYQMPLLS